MLPECILLDEAVTYCDKRIASCSLEEDISVKTYKKIRDNNTKRVVYKEWKVQNAGFKSARLFMEDAKCRRNVEEFDETSTKCVDKLLERVSKEQVPYSNVMKLWRSRSKRNDRLFHHPAHLNSPLNFALSVNGIHHPLIYVGPPCSATYIHRDDGMFPTVNSQLNDGEKLWIITHPDDNNKMINLLKSVSGIADEKVASWSRGGYLVPIATLKSEGIRIFSKIQRHHDTIMLGRGVFHMVVNLKLSVNIATNYIDEEWIQKGYPVCNCGKQHDWGRQIGDGKELKKKWLNAKIGVNKFPCSNCTKSYDQDEKLKSHVKEIHGQKHLPCSTCTKVFSTLKLKNAHEKTHAPKQMHCGACPYTKNLLSNLSRHKRESCNKITASRFACARCGKKYGSAKGLRCHYSECIVSIRKFLKQGGTDSTL